MSDISKLNGFDIKDATARSNHAALVADINTLVAELNAALEELEDKIKSDGASAQAMTTVAANTAIRYANGLYMCIPESTSASITIKPLYGSSITAKPIAFFIYHRVGANNPFYIDYSATTGQWARTSLTGYNASAVGSTPTISCSVAMKYVKIAGV